MFSKIDTYLASLTYLYYNNNNNNNNNNNGLAKHAEKQYKYVSIFLGDLALTRLKNLHIFFFRIYVIIFGLTWFGIDEARQFSIERNLA